MEKTENQSKTEATNESADASVEKADASVEDTSVEGVVASDIVEAPKSSDPVGERPIYNIQTSLDPTLDTHLSGSPLLQLGQSFFAS